MHKLAALSTASLLCCARGAPAGPPPKDPAQAHPPRAAAGTVRFETPRGPWLVEVELARTDAERARGLMFRTSLAPDHGMLFVFDETSEHTFWMHDTLLSLDMIFLGEDRAVAGVVAQAAPRTDTGRTVHKPSRYVVEVAGGEALAHGVGPGTQARFIGVEE